VGVSLSLSFTLSDVMFKAGDNRDLDGLTAFSNLRVSLHLGSSEGWGDSTRAFGEDESSVLTLNDRSHTIAIGCKSIPVKTQVGVSLSLSITLTQGVPPGGLESLYQKVVGTGGLDGESIVWNLSPIWVLH